MEKGYYHVYSFGEDTPKLLTTEREFVVAMNLLAYCTLVFGCKVMAFVFMNSHFHLILYGTEEECRQFGIRLMKMILHRINKARIRPYDFHEVAISADSIATKEDLMSIIAYVLRNPIEAGFRYDPRFYKWCSAALYFAPENEVCPMFLASGMIGEFPVRTRVATLGVHYDYPAEWTFASDGLILPKHYVDHNAVEAIFGGIKAFIAFMYMKKDRVFELNTICSKVNFQALSDEELEGLANRMAEKSHGRGFMNIDIVDRISLAKKLKSARGTGVKQLARVLDIKESVLSSIMS